VEFEATFAITLRPKCTKIPDGIQINWRAFMKQNLSLFNNISVRFPSAHQNSSKSNFHPVLQQPHQQQQSHQQQQQHIVSTLTPMAQLIPQRDHQVHTSLNLSALDPAVLASRLADSHLQDMPVCTTNQLHISHVASSIGNSPSNVYAPGMEVVFSTSMWQPSTTGVFSSDSLMPVHVQQHQQQAQQQYPHHQQHQEAQHAPLTSSSSSQQQQQQQQQQEPLLSRTVMMNGNSYLRRNCTFHESEACKICTSTEHTFEDHTTLLKKSKLCKKSADTCAYGPACVFSHSLEEQNVALTTLNAEPYVFNSDNMCYYSKPSRDHPPGSGYYFFVGCGSTTHTVKTSGGNCY